MAQKKPTSDNRKPTAQSKKKTPQKTGAKKSVSKETKNKKNNTSNKKPSLKWRLFKFLFKAFFFFTIIFGCYLVYLDFVVRDQFDGKKWALPARVYARPLEIYQGKKISPDQLEYELKALSYRHGFSPSKEGNYSRSNNVFQITTKGFEFGDGYEKTIPVKVVINDSEIVSIKHAVAGVEVDLVRLDPALIASIYPNHNEDRIIVKIKDVPKELISALIAVEDRNFYNHHGVAPLSIARAMYVNLKAGKVVQGGSTLTQQLIKNFHLSAERTILRKINEALMAVLLDAHYSKEEILEAYINEVYLGQDGKRAIHGFGLASIYYFDKNIEDLSSEQIALLVGMVRGASFYDPRRHPKRAKKLRDLVLTVMQQQNVITKNESNNAKYRSLSVTNKRKLTTNSYPAFVDHVKRQLRNDYKEEDLRTEGLRIFTTLSPFEQMEAENSLNSRIQSFGNESVQGAMVITRSDNGELIALVGGKNSKFKGFNRALDASRQIGSLIKPAVYLTALTNPDKYTLLTPLKDESFEITDHKGNIWSPSNYDNTEHGEVPLVDALSHSYNLATANLGLEIGVGEVVETLEKMGIPKEDIPKFPSLFLGAIQLTPFQVAQMYQSLATGGFSVRIRSIREVLDSNNKPLQRYPLSMESKLGSGSTYLVNYALKKTVEEGTAKNLNKLLANDVIAAGKTGTTNELRDSWFAGFTGDKLGVVWLGADDNQNINLTGSSGAMVVWGDFMSKVHPSSLSLTEPEEVILKWIDKDSKKQVKDYCKNAIEMPFIIGSEPDVAENCEVNSIKGVIGKTIDWLNGD